MPAPESHPQLATSTSFEVQLPHPSTTMSSLPTNPSSTRYAKPSHVQTNFPSTTSAHSVPASAISASSVTSSSLQASPIMSPDTTQLTTNNSSIQGSPDGPRGREYEFNLPPFELPESIVSRKTSQSAMSEAISSSKSPGLIRRLSNRASQFAGRRRQSSTTAMSREHSNGPFIMRRRSDSTNTAPEGLRGALYDSDDELRGDSHEMVPIPYGYDNKDFPSTTASIGSSTAPASGPVISSRLLQGTDLMKVTKKKKNKLLTFVLENEAAKVSWDKNRPSKSFYIDDIKDIRVGSNARNYRKECNVSEDDEARFFSIVYAVPDKSKGRSQKIMHLIAKDDTTFDLWTTTLDAISKHRQDMSASLSSFHDKAVRAYWQGEMSRQFQDKPHTEDDELIDLNGVERLCLRLHIHGSLNYIRTRFELADVSKSGRLNFVEFQDFVKFMKKREDVALIYRQIASDAVNGLTLLEFFTFLSSIQHEEVSGDSARAHWEGVFNKFVRKSKTKEQAQQDATDGEVPRMNEAALTSYLISTFNLPLKSAPAQYTLDRPFNEYFISSSHNTYLTGRQVAGNSSVEPYIAALNRGCRCVEVDCWDGADAPVVMHGRTLTSRISFADVMATIAKYAFVKSQYPLWISLEVHCNAAQQAMMAEIIKETCGSKLVTQPIDPSAEQLPTPSQLMNRILIKVKKPQQDSILPEQSGGRTRGNSVNSPYIRPVQLDNGPISAGFLPPSAYPQRNKAPKSSQLRYSGSEGPDSMSSSTSDSESLGEDVVRVTESHRSNKTSNIVKVLGELGVYSAGLKFRGFDTPDSKAYNHIFSFSENTFDKHSISQEDKRIITRHNMRYMLRVYPSFQRVSSKNFDPLKYWRRSVQMAAMNYQTYDHGMQINDAMFAGGKDQSGYVLKPSELREIKMLPNVPEEAGEGHVKRERKNVSFSIEVISAQQLMRPKGLSSTRSVDPYIEVEVYHADDKSKDNKGVIGQGGLDASSKDGSSGLGAPHRRRTKIVQENGFNPIFQEKFNFALTTKYPDLVFVRFSVKCSSDGHSYSDKAEKLPTYTAKLSSLQQGYRTLPLYDGNGDQFLFSTLFCRIKIDTPTSIYVDSPETTPKAVKGISRNKWHRNTPLSPKASFESDHR